MTRLYAIASACWEGDRTTAALLLSRVPEDERADVIRRLDSSSQYALNAWGLAKQTDQPRPAPNH